MPNWKTLFVGAAIAASVPLFGALAEFDPEKITDWRAWAVGIGSAVVRQVAIYGASKIAELRAGA